MNDSFNDTAGGGGILIRTYDGPNNHISPYVYTPIGI